MAAVAASTELGNVSVSSSDVDFASGRIYVAFLCTHRVELPVLDESKTVGDGILMTILRQFIYGGVNEYRSRSRVMHCEIAFFCSQSGRQRFGSEFMVSCSSRSPNGVCITPRRFTNAYIWLPLRTSEEEQRAIFSFLVDCMSDGYEEISVARFMCMPGGANPRRTKWNCCALTTSALQMLPCPELHAKRAELIDVDELYEMLERCSRHKSDTHMRLPPAAVKAVYSKSSGGAVLERTLNLWAVQNRK